MPGSSSGKDAGFSVQRHEFESRTGCRTSPRPAGMQARVYETR